jgi:hypothetical protein
MDGTIWLLIAIGVLVILLGIIAIWVNRGKKHEPDYYTFFIMGIIWLAVGIPLDNSALFIMGLVFMAVGLANKNKWKKKQKTWSKMNKKERKIMVILILIGLVLLVLGMITFLIVQKGLI